MKLTKVIFLASDKCKSCPPIEFISLQTNYELAEDETRLRLVKRTKHYNRYTRAVFIPTEAF